MTTESPDQPAPGANSADVDAKIGLLSEIRRMAAVIARSPERKRLFVLVAALIVVVASTATCRPGSTPGISRSTMR